MRIKSMTLSNFKGIKSLELNLDSKNLNIFGDNATGKTTIFDAFTWLLFDKDSSNRKDFGIKPYDKNGDVIHNLESLVEAVMVIGASEIKLKKTFQEKWTKKRGSADAEFAGHTIEYYINEVPVKKGEYEARLMELVPDEKTFRLLTDPLYFNEALKWSERREILINVCGNISDLEVIESDKTLSRLPGVLSGNSTEEKQKIIAARQKKINERLKIIPALINENRTSMPVLGCSDPEALSADIEKLQGSKDERQKAIIRIQSGGEISEKQKQLAESEAELLKIKTLHEEKKQSELSALREKADEMAEQYKKLNMSTVLKQNEVEGVKRYIKELEVKRQQLLDKWTKTNAEKLEFSKDAVCPTCGQVIPDEQMQEAREKAQAAFNYDKSQRLSNISADGKAIKAELDSKAEAYRILEEEFESLKSQAAASREAMETADKLIQEAKLIFPDISKQPGYLEKLKERLNLQQAILKWVSGNHDEISKLQQEIKDIDIEITSLQTEVAKIEQGKRADARIRELMAEEKTLAAEYEALEADMYLIERFVRAKVNLLTDKINSKFKLARFKLFDTQINGGIVECCETVYDGVPYPDLNNAAKINIGLDIINTLSDHHGFGAPVWVDNAESVTQLVDTRAQLIRLIVSEQDKKLRVEVK